MEWKPKDDDNDGDLVGASQLNDDAVDADWNDGSLAKDEVPLQEPCNVYRILIPSYMVSRVIGPKGNFIKKISKETGSWIGIVNDHQGTDSVVIISAKQKLDAIISPAMDGLLRVHKQTAPNVASIVSGRVKTRLIVPFEQAQSLTENRSFVERYYRDEDARGFAFRILPTDSLNFELPDDRLVVIEGTPSGVSMAVALIANHLRKFEVDSGIAEYYKTEMEKFTRRYNNMPLRGSWARQGFSRTRAHPQHLPSSSGHVSTGQMPNAQRQKSLATNMQMLSTRRNKNMPLQE